MILFENRIKEVFRVFFYSVMLTVLASCENVGGVILGLSDDSDIKTKEFYEGLLEHFCQKNYNDLYRDFWGTRNYIHNSLKVDSVCQNGEREVTVYGTHSFTGRIGKPHEGYKFVANVYETKNNSHDYIITFEKESKKIISRKSYIESRTRTFHYE